MKNKSSHGGHLTYTTFWPKYQNIDNFCVAMIAKIKLTTSTSTLANTKLVCYIY